MKPVAVGIDLGTTFSAIAYVNEHGVPEVLPNAEGDRITPSALLFEEQDVVVGTYAKQAATVYPDRVVQFVKRHIGEDGYGFQVGDKTWDAENLSHFVLAKLKHDAEQRLGRPVTQAVITVPAYFNDLQRRATLQAGKLAGLEVLALLNEPTAAAFAYGITHLGHRDRVLVFDLGGGTFDVTIVELGDKDITVLATRGDHQLGGKDWDDAIIDRVAQVFIDKHGVDPRDHLASVQDLRAKAVSAKLSLSRRPRVNIFHDYAGHVVRIALTREDFEVLTAHLMDRCIQRTHEVLSDAGLTAQDVGTVLLAGGSTRMPMVRQRLEELFGKPPATDINPDECVALGAALTAALESARRSGGPAPIDIRTHDVTSHSLGMVVLSKDRLANARLIPRNTRIPAEETRDDLVTTYDDQTAIDVWLVQGESDDPMQCTALGHFEFYGIPGRPAGESRLSITYRYNANAIVEVEAMDLHTGQILPYRVVTRQMQLQDVAAGQAPRQIILVMDCSGSMYGPPMKQARQLAHEFSARTLQTPNQKIGIVACPGGLRQHPTREGERVQAVIDSLVPIGSTPLHRTLERAAHVMRPEPGVQQVYVILSDGHVASPEGVAEQVRKLQLSGARIKTIEVGSRPRTDFLRSLVTSARDHHTADDTVELEAARTNVPAVVFVGGTS